MTACCYVADVSRRSRHSTVVDMAKMACAYAVPYVYVPRHAPRENACVYRIVLAARVGRCRRVFTSRVIACEAAWGNSAGYIHQQQRMLAGEYTGVL